LGLLEVAKTFALKISGGALALDAAVAADPTTSGNVSPTSAKPAILLTIRRTVREFRITTSHLCTEIQTARKSASM
jgi:hypothetical protein